jgi:hypothetical protein
MFLRSAPVCEPPIDGGAAALPRGAVPRGRADSAPPVAAEARRTPADPQVREFACIAMTLVLEALDRRRPAAQLARLLSPSTMAVVRSLVAGHAPEQPRAANLRVHSQAGADGGAEIYATFARGRRIHAIAARVEPRPPARQQAGRPLPAYVVTALATA